MTEAPDCTRAPRASVIIVNYNGADMLLRAVRSILAQTMDDLELIVFDNASSDDSMKTLDEIEDPRLTRICSPENLGFAGGNNRAAETARADWIAMLNPDAVAETDWLEQLFLAADTHPDVVMFASAQLSYEDETIMDGAGDCYSILGIPWRGGYGHPAEDMPGPGEVFSFCGAGGFIRKDAFLGVGGFDERFFCYCEDVDLGFRLRLKGERCLFWPAALIRHEGSAISSTVPEFAIWHGTRNRFWTYIKNMPALALALTLPGHLAAITYIWMRNWGTPRARPMRRGIISGFVGAGPILRERLSRGRISDDGRKSVFRAMSWDVRDVSRRAPVVKSLD